MCPVGPHRQGSTRVSLQGAIFLFFAGRIEAIKGNVDAVSNGGPGQCQRCSRVSQASRRTGTQTHSGMADWERQGEGRAGEALLTGTAWEEEGGSSVCGEQDWAGRCWTPGEGGP